MAHYLVGNLLSSGDFAAVNRSYIVRLSRELREHSASQRLNGNGSPKTAVVD